MERKTAGEKERLAGTEKQRGEFTKGLHSFCVRLTCTNKTKRSRVILKAPAHCAARQNNSSVLQCYFLIFKCGNMHTFGAKLPLYYAK